MRNRSARGHAAEAIYGGMAAPASRPQSYGKPNISVIQGQSQNQVHRVSTLVGFVGKVAAVLILAFTLLCVARVTLSSATVATANENQQISNQIDTARTEGSSLEIAQSKLSAPTRVKETAADMGMASPNSVLMIDISGDIVKTDSNGNLSLSQSISAMMQQQAS